MSGPRCEVCAGTLEEPHGHLVDTHERRLLCACYPCTMLFSEPGAGRGRFTLVPKRVIEIRSPLFTDAQWEALGIPIGLAFFFENSANASVTAFYPGPGGATESLLPMDAWQMLRDREPLLATMKPDVEAALVYRPRGASAQSYLVPIDACYELVGLIRTTWKGLDGGDAVNAALDGFFARLGERAKAQSESAV